VCDDKSDPNEATKCGRQAHDDGTLALFGSSGSFDGGTSAANLPGVLTGGGSVFDLTDPRSFSISSPLSLVVGGSATAAADRVYVMYRGRISLSGTADELRRRVDAIQSSYLANTST
jgi:hypothetical protein